MFGVNSDVQIISLISEEWGNYHKMNYSLICDI